MHPHSVVPITLAVPLACTLSCAPTQPVATPSRQPVIDMFLLAYDPELYVGRPRSVDTPSETPCLPDARRCAMA
jgi:hypothetical protein